MQLAATASGAGTTVVSNPFTPEPGIWVEIESENTGSASANTGATITDSLGTHMSWALLFEVGGGNTTGGKRVWGAFAPTGAATQMTVSVTLPSAPTTHAVTPYQVGGQVGADPTTPVVGAATNTNVGGSSVAVTVGATPTEADMLRGSATTRNQNSAITPGLLFWPVAGSEHHAASPSATSISEFASGVTATNVDFSTTGATWTGAGGWIIKLAGAGGGSTPIALGDDPGTGTDAIAVTATVPLADTGAGADGLTVAATVPLQAETGTGTDGVTVAATVPLADTGAGSDAVSVNGSIPLPETGAGSDGISVAGTIPLPGDTGTGTDAITVSATITLADTGTGTDAILVGVPTPLPGETGTGTDSIGVTATVPVSDARPVADALSVNGSIPMGDNSSGSDGVSVAGQIPLADPRPITDAVVVTATITLAELATAADAISIQVLVNLTDTGHGTDSLSVNTGPPPPTSFPYKAGHPTELWSAGDPTDAPPTGPAWREQAAHSTWSVGRPTSRSPS